MKRHKGLSLFTRLFTTSSIAHLSVTMTGTDVYMFVCFVARIHWPLLKTVFSSVACTTWKPNFGADKRIVALMVCTGVVAYVVFIIFFSLTITFEVI